MSRARRVDRSAATSTFARATSAEPSGVPRRKKDETGTMLAISGNSFLKTSTQGGIVFSGDLREAVEKRSDGERCRADGTLVKVPRVEL
jgi:hypothetical protein